MDSSCDKDGCDGGNVQQSRTGDNVAAFANLKVTAEKIRTSCGEICDTGKSGKPGKYVDAVWKNFDCEKLFANEYFDK